MSYIHVYQQQQQDVISSKLDKVLNSVGSKDMEKETFFMCTNCPPVPDDPRESWEKVLRIYKYIHTHTHTHKH
jgi:hypothetical protein